ncbi:MAG: hypothetical protein KKE39_09725 [Bacteroidetes bacterium]|nr:hypothetical protein [Bacteroidota bacterium]MBU1372662.1 hypothetical protein [Bacteroidota bacterium]MBU1484858.1 hypothetical protein [Bacteroidota bacterium]MBU1760997.1 hypothetical protein [Bacteroidota bacterium]MBU2266542.1 hypothetical protein [Bacteroidota bacterium]
MRNIFFIPLLVLLGSTYTAKAQSEGEEVLPQIEIGFKTITTGNYYNNKGNASLNIPILNEGDQVLSDFSDSYLMLGVSQKLYRGWRGQMVMGLTFPDVNSGLGQVFYNQVMLKVENQKNIIKLGRSTSQSTLAQFSTFRDDDAIQYNYVLNPFSGGINSQDNQYANVIEYTHILGQRFYVTFHGENYADFQNPSQLGINGLGGSVLYRMPQSQVWNRNVLQQVGFSVNNFINTPVDLNNGQKKTLTNLLATATFNLLPDPVHFIDFKIQAVKNFGLKDVKDIMDYTSYSRTKSTAVFGMLRYLNRKLERPRYQISAGVGYKTFSDIGNDTKQWMLISNAFYRIGNNFDLLVQYKYNQNNGELKPLLGNNQQRFQMGIAYTFNKIFNNQFDDRNSILNLEHGYIK